MSMNPSGVEKRGSGATVRACDSCRRRKRKCVWAPGVTQCTPCALVNEDCLTTHVRKPRAKSQKRTRIAEYENRVRRLESLLEERSAAQPLAQELPPPPADRSIPLSTYVGTLRDEVNSWPLEEGPHLNLGTFELGLEDLEEDLNLPLDFDSNTFQGTSNPESYSLATPNDPIADFQTEPDFLQDLSLQPRMTCNDSERTNSSVSSPQTRASCDGYLPPPELGTSLLREFLIDFNTAVPLYRPYPMADHIRNCYTGGSDGTPIAWASTYVIFGIAHRLRAMSAAATPQDNEQADYYLARILEKVSGLLFGRPCLCLVQCLLGTAILIQTSSHPEPHALFVSTALRMAQCLAYNDDHAQSLNADQDQDQEIDIEQQRRVFWIAFYTNAGESILSNTTIAHLRENIITSHPEDDPQDAAGAVTAAEGSWRVNIFSLFARLAMLQAEAIEQVLSVRCITVTPETISKSTTAVLQGLQAWRKHELFQMSSEQLFQLLYRSDLIHVLNLEAAYFATVFRVQAFLVLEMNSRANPFSTDILAKLSEQEQHPCLKDAKRLLNILSVAPQGDIGVCWMIKIPVIAALVTVLAHTLHHPSDTGGAPSRTEMREYGRILQMLGTLAQKRRDARLQTARELCMRLFSKVDASRRAA
ncbi:hypothetical protein K505DRAFT_376704 [Melanomma pulvis-pyrius CBS 109.77]|uniref:Zn(2)-C6 fungal-type domain-containing protein n=1 Tax=Melanomma pulvis-pyrius CBS 109.77 TaxID=1314802 RepID=A0A6A6X6H2_9PLEO|nr:hypothetical protein K505DRAFT_376704 [Melanomma pulvis-pyrius CBS 109.77]